MLSGLGAGHQTARSIFTVSDPNGATGQVSRIRKAASTSAVIAGGAFDIEAGRAYELLLGTGPAANCPLRFTGYVSETALAVVPTTTGAQASLWSSNPAGLIFHSPTVRPRPRVCTRYSAQQRASSRAIEA